MVDFPLYILDGNMFFNTHKFTNETLTQRKLKIKSVFLNEHLVVTGGTAGSETGRGSSNVVVAWLQH